ncbi:helix-turn-helix domain-containing protein [Vallitalea okinawensis]|uniref:helix-turn-helix domain-containing protein n=1 Tax=Vallitalea okinawensis TaxID=2078660 RepID=UPI000CFB58D6|nr:helix-turn-helix domain-containing protein [Vallitalea okinawensis]
MNKYIDAQFYTVKEVATILKITPKDVHLMIDQGRIPCEVFGVNIKRIPIAYINTLVEKHSPKEDNRREDYYLMQELNSRDLSKEDVLIQQSENQYVVYTKDMNNYLFDVIIYRK